MVVCKSRFNTSYSLHVYLQELRDELDKLLEYKITHPGVTSWNPNNKEGALMNAILDLITTEDHTPPTQESYR